MTPPVANAGGAGGSGASPTQAGQTASPSSASATSSATSEPRPAFDSDKAFALLQKQCDFGPRPLGTDAHEKCRDYLLAQMKKYADVTVTQTFTYRGMPVTNIVGVFYPAGASAPAKTPVLLLTHWDSRPVADGPYSSEAQKSPAFRYGAKGWNRETPILAANDGASGTAALLELARLFKARKPAVGVLLLLDDGEDYGDFRANSGQGDGTELGSRYFAQHFRDEKAFGQPTFGILLDMVGAKNAVFLREVVSQQYAPGTNEKVFGIAQALGYSDVFRGNETQQVGDDHLALNQAGIPTIDLIHPLPGNNDGGQGYRYWHTLQDTPDKCSPRTLKIVGETVAEVVYRETP